MWINDKDALLLDLKTNDWVEIFNDNGSCAHSSTSAHAFHRGMCFIICSPERTLGIRNHRSGNRHCTGGVPVA
ncbi:MAG: hypothetical protein IPK53_03960 [bacterium]|nr:hypothetical protein [bacterium]